MHLSLAEFDALDPTSLTEFVSQCLPEDAYLDYKQTIKSKLSDGEKREFAKDISAFANASGGLLLYGYDEPDIATQTPGTFIGVNDVEQIIGTLERVANSLCDPPLPGFRIRAITIDNERSAIACYVPQSEMQPHAVQSRFHIRGSESSQPMRTAEVRQSVLRSYSRRIEMKAQFAAKADELGRFWLQEKPGFILQAMPLIELNTPWEVQTSDFADTLRGHARNGIEYSLMSFVRPYVGVQCMQGDQSRDNTNEWHTEVHTSGLVCAVAPNHLVGPNQEIYLTSEAVCLFYAFGQLVDACLTTAKQPGCKMVLQATYRGASETVFYISGSSHTYGPPRIDNIEFPELFSDAVTSATVVSERYADMLFHAFGKTVPLGQRERFPWSSAE